MSEKIAYSHVRVAFVGKGRVDRVENELTVGMFDTSYCLDGVEGWMELKSPKEPVRPTTALFGSNHKLSQEQKNWCLRQKQAGGRAFILISTDKRWLLIDGDYADRFNEYTVQDFIDRASWHQTKPIRDKILWNNFLAALKK